MANKFAQEKARDELSFEPLPAASWLSVEARWITITVRYSEPLSRLLRSMTGARWDRDDKCWRIPFTSADEVRENWTRIDALAAEAKQSADEETRKHDDEKQRRDAERTRRQREEEERRASSRPVVMRAEFTSALNRPLFHLSLEAIDDANQQQFRSMGYKPRAWVAQVMGRDGRGRWTRAFLDGARDYSSANSIGSRGVTINFTLEEGPIYEVSAPKTWRSTDRYFCRVIEGTIQRMEESEVRQCLAR